MAQKGQHAEALRLLADLNRSSQEEESQEPPATTLLPKRRHPLVRSTVFAAIWFLYGTLTCSGGVIGLFTLFFALPFMVLRTLLTRQGRAAAKRRLGRIAIYGTMAVVSLAVFTANNNMAARRAVRLVSACEQYKAKHGSLPDRLDQLVPEFMDTVPLARYSLSWNQFFYQRDEENKYVLWYIERPPYGRRLYSSETAMWTLMD